MNRALPLFAAVALVGGGLAYFASQTGTSKRNVGSGEAIVTGQDIEPPARPERRPTDATSSGAASLANVGDAPDGGSASIKAGAGGFAKVWDIIPMNPVGQSISTAKITAVPGDAISGVAKTLTGEGRMKFKNVASGPWEVTVTADGCPTWNRVVMVPAGGRYPTTARLGNELRIVGEIRDTNGAPVKDSVYFLAAGASHPRKRDSGNKTPAALAKSGQHAAKPSGKGRFQTVLPEAGKYRVSVGQPGKARWTEATATELTHGGTDHVIITVPARAELTATFAGTAEERPTQVSVYYFDADAAARQMENRARDLETKMERKSVADAQREAKEAAIKKKEAAEAGGDKDPERERDLLNEKRARLGARGGTARTMQEENERVMRDGFKEHSDVRPGTREPLFEPGWRNMRSLGIPVEGDLVIADLPENKDLRFLFVRRSERITTLTPTRLREGARMSVLFTLPPPSLLTGIQTSNLATASVSKRTPPPGEEVLAPGTGWSFANR